MSCSSDRSSGTSMLLEGESSWKERLWESLVAFEAVQREHRKAFASGRCDNLMARRAERERVLARLHMELEAAQPHLLVGEDDDFTNRVQAKFSVLIDMETALAESVRTIRKHMLDALGAIRQGRRVLKGYGQHHDGSPHPRLLNRKT